MLQILLNSIVYASEIAVIAVGISLAYSVVRFANFAHIQYAVLGGYFTYAARGLGLGFPVATAISAVLTGLVAIIVERLVFHPLRGLRPEAKMIASWGVALAFRSGVAAVFGGAARVFDVETDTYLLGDAVITSLDLAVVATTIAAMVVLQLLLYRTRIGTGLRALADNRDLAATRGIPPDRLTALMWFLAGAFAALGGTLFALETRLQPDMDLQILLPVFAAVTIGGLSSIAGAVAGACILSLAQNIAIGVDFGAVLSSRSWFLPSQFRDTIAVAAMVLVLCFRPRQLRSGGVR
ncbi:branched-chain amino acid ABC transporter permease [Lichenifustis flavocetrariae]|uniref:Branched-chain amino acid ABC transporter permease n=1 Tax=Lichenifustis flavocetrariae TaxID=2949735 RepID=A0AA41YWZ9_9HYPH|nr:branched-chain amino acid ABC transporter permease [Lichenifustis flavocetrariae]MCW6509669.1 branched-chain amino acid ABC transporter permease [Lichenifustis flavocetrariae]